jgi:hypothetical protein
VAEPLSVALNTGTVWSGPAFTTGAWFCVGVGVGVAVGIGVDVGVGVGGAVAVAVGVELGPGVGVGVGVGLVLLIWTIFATEGTPFEFRMNSI